MKLFPLSLASIHSRTFRVCSFKPRFSITLFHPPFSKYFQRAGCFKVSPFSRSPCRYRGLSKLPCV